MDLKRAEPIKITDKSLFDEYFRNYPPEISEFTFTNLFIWRNYYNSSFLEYESHLLLFSNTYLKEHKASLSKNPETLFFMPPIGPHPEEIIVDLFKSLNHIEIHRVPATLVNQLSMNNRHSSLNIQWIEDRDNWDYVYAKEKLISLSGRKLYNKRRWLNRFLERYPDHEFHLLSEEWVEICKELQIEWCDMNECRMHEDLVEEQKVITDAFNFYPELEIRGGLLLIGGKCIAYTLGERLNPTTAVIHIEKALSNYEGAYQAINQHFAKKCCQDVNYINREQDLGDPGLRQAKETYIPHHMVEKYLLFQK